MMCEEGPKGKETLSCPIFSVIIFSMCGWLIQGSKKGYVRVPWFFVILRTSLPLDFSDGPMVKNLPANAGDTGSIPGPGRFHMPRGN